MSFLNLFVLGAAIQMMRWWEEEGKSTNVIRLVNWAALSAILWNCTSSNHPASLIGCKLFLAKDHDSLLGGEEDGWNYSGWVASSFLVPVGLSIAMNPPALLIFFARCPVRCQESGGGNNQLCPYLCILCICIFVQSNPSDPTWAALISPATSDPCWATTHWDNSP